MLVIYLFLQFVECKVVLCRVLIIIFLVKVLDFGNKGIKKALMDSMKNYFIKEAGLWQNLDHRNITKVWTYHIWFEWEEPAAWTANLLFCLAKPKSLNHCLPFFC